MQRRSISVDTFAHKSPIPNASRIGNVIASGLIRGAEADGTFTPDMNRQCELMFQNMKTTVEAGGGSVDDIIKLTVWMEKLDRAPINAQWSKMFPDHELAARTSGHGDIDGARRADPVRFHGRAQAMTQADRLISTLLSPGPLTVSVQIRCRATADVARTADTGLPGS